jgi:hypothetical protein
MFEPFRHNVSATAVHQSVTRVFGLALQFALHTECTVQRIHILFLFPLSEIGFGQKLLKRRLTQQHLSPPRGVEGNSSPLG